MCVCTSVEECVLVHLYYIIQHSSHSTIQLRSLHPAFPAFVDVSLVASGCAETRFTLKSPLCGKTQTHAPAPYWAVLDIDDPSEANMTETEATVTFATPIVAVKGAKQTNSKRKPATLTLTMPVLVNKGQIDEGVVLTVHRANWRRGDAEDSATT